MSFELSWETVNAASNAQWELVNDDGNHVAGPFDTLTEAEDHSLMLSLQHGIEPYLGEYPVAEYVPAYTIREYRP